MKIVLYYFALMLVFTGCTNTTDKQLSSANKYLMRACDGSLIKGYGKDSDVYLLAAKHKDNLIKQGGTYITDVPKVFRVGIGKEKNADGHTLVIYWLEKETDVVSFKIREVWNSREEISEIYNFLSFSGKFMETTKRGGVIYALAYPFFITERKDLSQRKNDKHWEEWLKEECEKKRLVSWGDWLTDPNKKERPVVFIARPSKNVEVFISLIDSKGNKSQEVKLPKWIELNSDYHPYAIQKTPAPAPLGTPYQLNVN